MIEVIEELEKRGLRVSIYPRLENKQWYWIAGLYVGNDPKAVWIDTNNGLPKAAYNSYKDALDAIIKYCNEGQKRSTTKIPK